jgi:hypothetical protein
MKESDRATVSKSAVEVNCFNCQTPFKVFPYKADKRNFCSIKCKQKYTVPLFLRAAHQATRGRKQTEEEIEKRRKSLPCGEAHHFWKGHNVQYRSLHMWVESKLGKPHMCEVCGKDGLSHRQYHWANLSGQYMRDLEDWLRMCVKCHRSYDREMKLLGVIEKAY